MPSLQSYVLKYIIRHTRFYFNESIDPKIVRDRADKIVMSVRPNKHVNILSVNANSVTSEWLVPVNTPRDRALLYIHGGAWMMGSTITHRFFVSMLAQKSNVRALSINYRLAPENPFPAGLEDCITAYEWLLENGISPQNIVVAGDSAGGNLTLALLIALRDAGKPLPAGAVALSPATDLAFTGESVKTRKHLDPFFADMQTSSIVDDYLAENDPYNPLISPLYADLTGLPPLLLHVGSDEILLDDTVRFGKRAVASGVNTKMIVWQNMFHVFQMTAPILPEARQAIIEITRFIRSLLYKNPS